MYISCTQDRWLITVKDAIRDIGYVIVKDIFPSSEKTIAHTKMYSARDQIIKEIGEDRLKAANEYGVLRCMMKFEPYFLSFLQNPALCSIVDALLGSAAILHLQNGFILPSYPSGQTPPNFQNNFHRDFPRFLNGYVASINILFAIDAFAADNGGTRLVPGSHQRKEEPDTAYMESCALSPDCPEGSAIVFDSTLWHAAGINTSGKDRLAINHQFTRSFFKPQMDYVRILGETMVQQFPDRVRQFLGFYSRPPASLEEYYRPEGERVYRKDQG